MTQQHDPALPDVQDLLDRSQPQPRGLWLWYAVGIFFVMVLLSTYATSRMSNGPRVVELLATLGMGALVAVLVATSWNAARSIQREQQHVHAIEELIQLRRWSEAAVMLHALLNNPMRSPNARLQVLVYLAALLARFHRFGDAVTVYDYLLNLDVLDDQASYGLKMGRAMSLLQEDRLVDADRAIGELRRTREGRLSGGLALVEIYRDVKTGHPQEAIDLFGVNLGAMRQQLGHRVADAYALVAKAYDMQGKQSEASSAYEAATLLAPELELHRRYPELRDLAGRYVPANPPAEVA